MGSGGSVGFGDPHQRLCQGMLLLMLMLLLLLMLCSCSAPALLLLMLRAEKSSAQGLLSLVYIYTPEVQDGFLILSHCFLLSVLNLR